jgi:hypothetical protein
MVSAGIFHADPACGAGLVAVPPATAASGTGGELPEMLKRHSGKLLSVPPVRRNPQAQLPELQPDYRAGLGILPLL